MIIKKISGLSFKKIQNNCINCKYFVLRKLYDYDNSIISETSYCSKFVTKNPVSGIMKEELALKCRSNEKMCGIDAKYFTSRDSMIIKDTVYKHTIFIKNNNSACVDCKFGAPHIPNDPFEERYPIDYNYRCKKFITTDIVSGKKENKLANICRSDEKMCGMNAKYFTKK